MGSREVACPGGAGPARRVTGAALEGGAPHARVFGPLMAVLLDRTPLSGSTAQGVRTWELMKGGFGVTW